MQLWPGSPYPLGATWDGEGTNFAVFSAAASGGMGVALCLFDGDGAGRETRLPLTERTGDVWHGYVAGVGPGQRYGFRVFGPFDPGRGLRGNGAKLLLDPYALAIDGEWDGDASVFDYRSDNHARPDDRDSAPHVPRSVVVDPEFPWGDEHRPETPWPDTVIYETHVRGLTMRHPGVPEDIRGTYAGLGSPAVIDHLTSLGVTAVELLPVHHLVPEPRLAQHGLANYWGYASVGFFAPHAGYAASGGGGGQVAEFKAMVRELHAAGLEVILDVVYNHTCEGGAGGPTLGFRGLDNPAYYRLDPADATRYTDVTGTGNTVNVPHPEVLRLVMSSLRYWITEMHVDGFRFDLAPALAREPFAFERNSAFLRAVHQDPVVSRSKLIAEPWDMGDHGYQVGGFPVPWSEWNDRYRNGVRDFWRGGGPGIGDLAYRLTGSSDLYRWNEGRRPPASVNFVTAHDGFTLTDLVSYDHKHNEANQEGNADGTDDNRSWNCGAEGPTDDPGIITLRQRQRRNLLATLLFSQGVPMLLGGDEMGRTQQGNNNAYCQDNAVSWYDWDAAHEDADLLAFTTSCIALRRQHPVFRRRSFFQGRPIHEGSADDIDWVKADGEELTHDDWMAGGAVVGMYLNGGGIDEPDARGRQVIDDCFLLLFNGGAADVEFVLPGPPWAGSYEPLVDTRLPRGVPEGPDADKLPAGAPVTLLNRSFLMLRALPEPG